MTRKIYEAIRKRISTLPYEEEKPIYDERGWTVPPSHTFYRFDSDGLNVGYGDDEAIDSMVHPMLTRNMWNVCQRFYSFIKYHENINERLLNS